jgi:hypothetical protein
MPNSADEIRNIRGDPSSAPGYRDNTRGQKELNLICQQEAGPCIVERHPRIKCLLHSSRKTLNPE